MEATATGTENKSNRRKSRPSYAAVGSIGSLGLILFFLYLMSLQQGTSAIKCWVCRSDGDPKCADPFDNRSFPITDCKQEKPRDHLPGLESTMCRKVRQKVNGNWRYIRSCAWLGEPGIGRDERYCIHRSGTYNIHVEYCTCRSKDGCNGANSRHRSSAGAASVVVPLLASLALLRFNNFGAVK